MAFDATPALIRVYDLVVADLATRVPAASPSFGWRKPARQGSGTAHIDWYPGQPDSGEMGADVPARYVGQRTHRHLADTQEYFTVNIHAHDPAKPDDERAQYIVTRTLYHIWRACLYRAALGIHTIEKLTWLTEKNEFRLGCTLQVVVSLLCPTPDDGTEELDLTAVQLNLILGQTPGPVSPIEITPS